MADAINTRFHIKQGDLLKPLRGRIIDKDDPTVGQDLTGATLKFHMSDEDGTVLINADASIDGDQNVEEERGWWKYEWQTGDTGPYNAKETVYFTGEIQATFAGKPLTAPNDRMGFTIIMAPQIA